MSSEKLELGFQIEFQVAPGIGLVPPIAPEIPFGEEAELLIAPEIPFGEEAGLQIVSD